LRNNFLDKRNSYLYSDRTHQKSGLASALTLTSPTQPTPTLVKRKESTMPDNTITDTHAKSETPNAVVTLTPSDL